MDNLFSQMLKELRYNNRCTQAKLATDLKISKGIVSLWENGLREPTLSSLIAIADYFDVTLDYLVGRVRY